MRTPGKLLAQIIMGVGAVFLIVLGGLFGIEEYLIQSGRIDQAIAFFPYFPIHQPLFLSTDRQLSPQSREKLDYVYAYSTDYYHYLINTSPIDQKGSLIERLYVLDPWQRIFQDPAAYYIQSQDWNKAEAVLNDTVTFLERGFAERQYSREEILYKQKANWAKQLMTLAEHQALTTRINEAADSTIAAQYFDEWVLAHSPLLPLKLETWEAREQFLLQTVEIDPKYWGDYREDLANMWLEIMMKHLAAGDWTDSQLAVANQHLLGLAEMRTNLLWERATAQELPTIQAALAVNDLDTAAKRANMLLVLWQGFDKFKYQYPQYKEEVNADRVTELAQVYEDIARRAPAVQRYDLLIKLDTALLLRPSWSRKVDELYIPLIQAAADKALLEQRPDLAEPLIKQMVAMAPYDYWVLSQMGNFYVAVQQFDQATAAFIHCREQLDYYHEDCENSLKEIVEKKTNDQRYYQVGSIIQKKNKWQDFTLLP